MVLTVLIGIIKLGLNEPTLIEHLNENTLHIFVSILPQKFFVEKIGAEKVKVSVLVGPGQSPATYEPLPKQLTDLSQAHLYFRIGVPFEIGWLDKIQNLNPNLDIVDTRKGIELRPIEASYQENKPEQKGEQKDPHIWLDPLLVKLQAETICRELSRVDPINQGFYEANLGLFVDELEELHRELNGTFQKLAVKNLMVFHPAWGYLTDRYGLRQIPIELEGKEPGPQELAKIIEIGKKHDIRVVFIQSQFNTEVAQAISQALDGKIVAMDPLAEDYLYNMRSIARIIKEEL